MGSSVIRPRTIDNQNTSILRRVGTIPVVARKKCFRVMHRRQRVLSAIKKTSPIIFALAPENGPFPHIPTQWQQMLLALFSGTEQDLRGATGSVQFVVGDHASFVLAECPQRSSFERNAARDCSRTICR